MFTRCPNCAHPQPLTAAQLRITRAILACPHCGIQFDALEQLSDDPVTVSAINPEPVLLAVEVEVETKLPWEQASPAPNPHWRSGVLVGLMLLALQVLYGYGTVLSRSPRTFCPSFICAALPYQNAAELAIVQSALETLPDNSHLFSALIVNQAAFAQPYPNIDLTLRDYSGNALAHRVFRPHDYLFNPEVAVIAPEASATLKLNIAPTVPAAGGYTFDLTY